MRISLIILIVGSFFSTIVMAQAIQGRPVDQGVGDLDLLSRSSRQLTQGLRSNGEHTSLFAVPRERVRQLQQLGGANPLTSRTRSEAFYRVSPGVTAQMDQPNYWVPIKQSKGKKQEFAQNVSSKRDGLFLETIPANTVFILSPDMNQVLTSPLATHVSAAGNRVANPALMSQRIDRRIDRRIDGRHQRRIVATRIENKVIVKPVQPWQIRLR